MEFASLLRFAVEHGASDVHIQSAAAPMLRLAGQMRSVEGPALSREDVLGLLQTILPAGRTDDPVQSAVQGLDFAYELPGVARFRCSAFSAMGQLGLTMRALSTKIPSIEELHLPKVVHDIALSGRGLTLVTGTTGSGKSTTLAAMIDLINSNRREKIISIEDPVEYIHTNKKALISQLEVGSDTPSFDQALRQALRQDPDVVLIGELRDVETLRIYTEFQGRRQRLILAALQPQVRDVFVMTRLDRLFEMHDDMAAAKRAVGLA